MDFANWLRAWLKRHPLREPSKVNPQQYTEEVMTRIRALDQPAPQRAVFSRPWFLRPQVALVTAVATAALVLVAVNLSRPPAIQLAEEVDQEIELLAALGEALDVEPLELDGEALAEALEEADRLMLAEAARTADERWIEETLELLEEFEEEFPTGFLDDAAEDEWLDELEWLDTQELGAGA